MVIVLCVFPEQISGLLPAEKKQVLLNTLPRREPFKILFRLNCDNLFADFHEDLNFRFSWGPDGSDSKNSSLQVSILYIIVSVTGNGLI